MFSFARMRLTRGSFILSFRLQETFTPPTTTTANIPPSLDTETGKDLSLVVSSKIEPLSLSRCRGVLSFASRTFEQPRPVGQFMTNV